VTPNVTNLTSVTPENDGFASSGDSPPTCVGTGRGRSRTAKQPRKRRMNPDAAPCAELLRTLAAPRRLRIVLDDEGWPFIPGKYGQIECADPEGRTLAVYCDRPRLFRKLLAVAGVRRHQTGDDEIRALFSVEAFEQVARVIRVRRKPGLSREMARKVGAKTALRGSSAGSHDALDTGLTADMAAVEEGTGNGR